MTTTRQYSDIDVISGLQTDNEEMFQFVFDKFFYALCYFGEGIISNKEEAQDIVINTFHKFWQLRKNFATLPNIKAFLYITTRNACFNFLKARQRKNANQKAYIHLQPASEETPLWEHHKIQAEVLRKIYEEIEELPDRCRQVFKLTYFEGLKADAIAKQLGITVSTVTSQRARAIQLLRIALSDQELVVLYLFMAGTFKAVASL